MTSPSPSGPAIELAADAWTWLSLRLGQYARAGVSPVNLTAHARFGRGSEALLASSAGRATCHLEVLCFAGNHQRALFQTELNVTEMRQSYAVSADGQRFLLNTPLEAGSPPITVVLNWAALLKK